MNFYQAVVFDLDGVLIDSKECMDCCWAEVRSKTGIQIPFTSYFSQIGKPFRAILSTIGVPENLWSEVEEIYFKTQLQNQDLILKYPGTQELLDQLLERNYVLGLVTSKGSIATSAILSKFNWSHFSTVVTPESCVRGKPYPDPLLYFSNKEHLSPETSVYIGDMTVDLQAAESAGFSFIRAGWGYQNFDCDITCASPMDLLSLV